MKSYLASVMASRHEARIITVHSSHLFDHSLKLFFSYAPDFRTTAKPNLARKVSLLADTQDTKHMTRFLASEDGLLDAKKFFVRKITQVRDAVPHISQHPQNVRELRHPDR